MDEKNYKNYIEQDGGEDFSLEEILAEYNSHSYDMAPEGGSLRDRSKRFVMEAIDDSVGAAAISSIDELDDIVDDSVSREIARSAADMLKEDPEPAEAQSIPEARTEDGNEACPDTEDEPDLGLADQDIDDAVPPEETAEEESAAEESMDAEQILSEYELRSLVDSDERDRYADYDPEEDYPEDGEEEGSDGTEKTKRSREKKKKSSGKQAKELFLSPVIAVLALLTHKRSKRVQADSITATADDEDSDIPEMAPEKASAFYGKQLWFLRLRAKIAAAVGLVMVYITLAYDSFLPMAGAMNGAVGSSLVLLIMLLTVMLCGLDVLTAGIMSLVRGRPTADSMVSLSCIFAAADALLIGLSGSENIGLPFCAAAAVSMCFSLWGACCTCIGLRRSFKLMASKKASAITAEKGVAAGRDVLMKSERGISGAVRRSEMADITEYVYNILSPVLVACALVFGALASFFNGNSSAFVHCVSAMLAVSAAFGAGICFALPFAISSKKLYSVGVAICGWAGVRDIGRSKNVVIRDNDIFPRDEVGISAIRVLEGAAADKVISYTGSVIVASGNGMAAAFSGLMERNGYSICRVENFLAHDGGGVTAVVNGESVMVGSTGFMNLMGIRVPGKIATRDTVFSAINGSLVGIFNIEYKVTAAAQDALGLLHRTRREPIFALRDFNLSPVAIENKFHLPADKINFPAFSERFRISAMSVTGDSPVAAVVCREGMVPVVEMSERGRKLYLGILAGTVIAAGTAAAGLVIMFLSLWKGDFNSAMAAKALLLMLLPLLPQALICFWLQR